MRRVGCGGEQFDKAGRSLEREPRYRCVACDRWQTDRTASPFRGYRFPADVIALAVRWYLYYQPSSADVAELLAERGVHVDPSTVFDWVQRFSRLRHVPAHGRRAAIAPAILAGIVSEEEACHAVPTLRIIPDPGAAEEVQPRLPEVLSDLRAQAT